MFNLLDNILNRVTMYRLMLYYLIGLLVAAFVLGLYGIIPYTPVDIFMSAGGIAAICWVVNQIFARVYRVPANAESAYITALILVLIIPPTMLGMSSILPFVFWVAVWAMASKYMINVRGKHIFNPAAFAAALTAVTLGLSANWWVGNIWFLPFVLIGGFLMTRKLLRWDLVLSFLGAAAASIVLTTLLANRDAWGALSYSFLNTALFFFALVMLTEPLTTPPRRGLRIVYGILVGALYAPALHIGSVYSTPELALLAGNLFSYIVSPKYRRVLTLRAKIKLGPDIYEFVFTLPRAVRFRAGQYMEWTLGHEPRDSRGNRRYFTLASSPTERELRIGVKFYDPPSTFKNRMLNMQPGDEVLASQIAGDFTLPKDSKEKLVFIAGGIGVTPFRSMVKYMMDKNERRPAVLLYAAKDAEQFAYKDLFDAAEEQIGLKPVYVAANAPPSWRGLQGNITPEMIRAEVPDFRERTFYISGPHAMVTSFEDVLERLGVSKARIKTDFFPGYA